MQLFCALRGVRHPFTFQGLDSAASSGEVVTAPGESLTLHWEDSTVESYDQGLAIRSAYGGGAVDTTVTVYLVVAVKGHGFYWLKEADQDSADAVLLAAVGSPPATAILYRVDGGQFYPVPQ